jgi:hypothetical protein
MAGVDFDAGQRSSTASPPLSPARGGRRGSAVWRVHLPAETLALLDACDQKNFDVFMDIGLQSATRTQLIP